MSLLPLGSAVCLAEGQGDSLPGGWFQGYCRGPEERIGCVAAHRGCGGCRGCPEAQESHRDQG